MNEAETKACNLHKALRSLLNAYIDLQKETDTEPLFESEGDPDKRAERALFDNSPLADWEPKKCATCGGFGEFGATNILEACKACEGRGSI